MYATKPGPRVSFSSDGYLDSPAPLTEKAILFHQTALSLIYHIQFHTFAHTQTPSLPTNHHHNQGNKRIYHL